MLTSIASALAIRPTPGRSVNVYEHGQTLARARSMVFDVFPRAEYVAPGRSRSLHAAAAKENLTACNSPNSLDTILRSARSQNVRFRPAH